MSRVGSSVSSSPLLRVKFPTLVASGALAPLSVCPPCSFHTFASLAIFSVPMTVPSEHMVSGTIQKHEGKFPRSLSRRNSIRDAPNSFFEGSWESAAAVGAVSPRAHPHKSCLMPRPLSCNAGNRVSTPRSRAGQATRDAERIPCRQ
jgi:hypothetical protein